jgi:hypothetical protein
MIRRFLGIDPDISPWRSWMNYPVYGDAREHMARVSLMDTRIEG